MEENVNENELGGNKDVSREELYSKSIRSGKRTYFFDVKSTRQDELYLTITESKKRFSPDGSFQYEKHKIFLYREDFGNFAGLLAEMIEFIDEHQVEKTEETLDSSGSNYADFKFEDLTSS